MKINKDDNNSYIENPTQAEAQSGYSSRIVKEVIESSPEVTVAKPSKSNVFDGVSSIDMTSIFAMGLVVITTLIGILTILL